MVKLNYGKLNMAKLNQAKIIMVKLSQVKLFMAKIKQYLCSLNRTMFNLLTYLSKPIYLIGFNNNLTNQATRVNILLAINWTIQILLFNIKKQMALISTCHHIIGVLKWTRVNWSMNVPWCATCHHLSGINFND